MMEVRRGRGKDVGPQGVHDEMQGMENNQDGNISSWGAETEEMKSLLFLDFVVSALHPLYSLSSVWVFCSVYLLFQTVFDVDSCFRQPVGLLNSFNSTCFLFIFLS